MTPRTHGAIGVGQIPNGTGTCKLYNLHTRKIISANHITEIPMSADIIAHMNALAAKDNRPTDPRSRRSKVATSPALPTSTITSSLPMRTYHHLAVHSIQS